ncbi:MAG: serine/threonine-protein kinase [Acidobacteriota bacterium]
MSPKRWREIEAIFHLALEAEGEDRRRLLDSACGASGVVRAEVESLLDALGDSTTFDRGAVPRLAGDLLDSADGDRTDPGDDRPTVTDTLPSPGELPLHIGAYRLVEVAGRGGMGTVYLAEQTGPLPRRVAFKILHAEESDAIRRFELERESLARMGHSSIAQVYDAGSTDGGRPFVVLEYIEGSPITTFCDAKGLDLRQRVELVIQVCEAVGHAHGKAVIHRDLKPSNILVTESGGKPHPKVIDFGIAKALIPWSPTGTPDTQSFLRVGSLAYMSPEALLHGGKAVDTRSDIFALGVVLSELLAGVRPPLRIMPPRPSEALDGARPSQQVLALTDRKRRLLAEARGLRPKDLAKRLRPELDWILRRATAYEPEGRYPTAGALADDLRRWLEGRPVAARPDDLLYRTGRLVRRHAAPVAAALVVTLLIVGFAISSRVLYQRAESARTQAEALVGFMLDDLSEELEPLGHLELLESVSRRSLAYFDATPEIDRRDGRPSAALRHIGRVLMARGDFEASEAALARAVRLETERLEALPSSVRAGLDLAHAHYLLGDLHQERRKLDESDGEFQRALDLLDGLLAARSAEADVQLHDEARRLKARTLTLRATVQRYRGEHESARPSAAEAIEQLRALEDVESSAVRRALAEAHYTSGLIAFFSFADIEAAIHDFTTSTSIYRELTRAEPGRPNDRHRLAIMLGQGLATAYHNSDRLELALEANREALDLFEALTRRSPENGHWAHAFGWEWIRRAQIHLKLGDIETASRAATAAIEVHKALVDSSTDPSPGWLNGLAQAYVTAISIASEGGDDRVALEMTELEVSTRRRVQSDSGRDRWALADALMYAGELRFLTGDTAGARRSLSEVSEFLEALSPQDSPQEYPGAYGQLVERAETLQAQLDGHTAD